MNKTNSWIHDLIEENLSVETPTSWLYWSLMTCISAAAANNYFIPSFKGSYIYYPNLYVILLGESGLGKGYGISLAKKLVSKAEITRVFSGRSSIQAIVKELATSRSKDGKAVITDSRGYVVNGELSSAIISDPDSLTILTDLFDRNDNPEWANRLKGDGVEQLKDPYVTCLFGSSPAHFYDSIPQANIEGGYIGRNLIIYEDKRAREIDPLDHEDNIQYDNKFDEYLAPQYVPHLIKISQSPKTRLIPDEDARKIYNSWRRDWKSGQSVYNDTTGFINRVPDHTLRVAICLALSRYNNETNIINKMDIIEAIDKVTGLVYANKHMTSGTGMDDSAKQTKKVIDILINSPANELSRRDMLIAGYGNFDGLVLDKIIDTLMDMGWLSREMKNAGKKDADWLLKLDGEPLRSYKKFKEQQGRK